MNKYLFVGLGVLLFLSGFIFSEVSAKGNQETSDFTYAEYLDWLENYSYEDAVKSGATPDSREAFERDNAKTIKMVRSLPAKQQESFMHYVNNPDDMLKALKDESNENVWSEGVLQ